MSHRLHSSSVHNEIQELMQMIDKGEIKTKFDLLVLVIQKRLEETNDNVM